MYLGRYPLFYRMSAPSSPPPSLGNQTRWTITGEETEKRADRADIADVDVHPTSAEAKRELPTTTGTVADPAANSHEPARDSNERISSKSIAKYYIDVLSAELEEPNQEEDDTTSPLSSFHHTLFNSFQLGLDPDNLELDTSVEDEKMTGMDDEISDQTDLLSSVTNIEYECGLEVDNSKSHSRCSSVSPDIGFRPTTTESSKSGGIYHVPKSRARRFRRIKIRQ
ncbi:uncharacterized protein F4807DRAFT_458121 [Annulohypoxylon truncatum]|uniref:uncharacterized protein n=1 Tax=Annulohypoxylon truncatum TaxID=327061 RepID=UPI0020087D5E|nr:uncharacterized protein F4807DRAFT_458121 [Annulohypoxylon truncatum]KAI1211916.1 hypothetical protein F4807DRAFT_458121 [Annulohypoxylon truncatum]